MVAPRKSYVYRQSPFLPEIEIRHAIEAAHTALTNGIPESLAIAVTLQRIASEQIGIIVTQMDFVKKFFTCDSDDLSAWHFGYITVPMLIHSTFINQVQGERKALEFLASQFSDSLTSIKAKQIRLKLYSAAVAHMAFDGTGLTLYKVALAAITTIEPFFSDGILAAEKNHREILEKMRLQH